MPSRAERDFPTVAKGGIKSRMPGALRGIGLWEAPSFLRGERRGIFSKNVEDQWPIKRRKGVDQLQSACRRSLTGVPRQRGLPHFVQRSSSCSDFRVSTISLQTAHQYMFGSRKLWRRLLLGKGMYCPGLMVICVSEMAGVFTDSPFFMRLRKMLCES